MTALDFNRIALSTYDGGLGLAGMRERVESIGGVLALESKPGSGAKVLVTIDQPKYPEMVGEGRELVGAQEGGLS